MFLGNHVNKNDFFTSTGKSRFNFRDNLYYKEKNHPEKLFYLSQKRKYNIQLLKLKYGATKVNIPIHQARPIVKNVFSVGIKRSFLKSV